MKYIHPHRPPSLNVDMERRDGFIRPAADLRVLLYLIFSDVTAARSGHSPFGLLLEDCDREGPLQLEAITVDVWGNVSKCGLFIVGATLT
jgi:hypothetical protein